MRFSIKRLHRICLLILTLSPVTEAETSQWTRFRGSDGRGIDTMASVPVSWDSSDYIWNIELPGTGNSSPVVWGNKIFVVSADDEKDIGYVMAVDSEQVYFIWYSKERTQLINKYLACSQ